MWKMFLLCVAYLGCASSHDLDELEPYVEEGFMGGVESILDVGCGSGAFTAALAKRFPEIAVVGCDIDKEALEKAQKNFPPSEYPNLSFVERDACQLGYKSQFDRVVSLNCLQSIDNQKTALKSIYESLRPGGKVFILATPKSSNNDFKTISQKVIISFKWLSYFINFSSSHSFHSERDYKKILKGIGFSVEHMEQRPHEKVISDRAALNTFLMDILPVSHLPPSRRPVFLSDYYDQLVKNGNVYKDGSVHFHFDKIEMIVSKPPAI
jgi:ubiquinone/menaquinone biosynthesis C-methylase UbiE